MVTYDKLSPEEEEEYMAEEGIPLDAEPETEETVIQHQIPKTNSSKGKIRRFVRKEWQDIKEYVKKKAEEHKAQKEAFAKLPPEEQSRIRKERVEKVKGFFSTQPSEEQARPLGMSEVMQSMFGTQQQTVMPSQRTVRQSLPPAQPTLSVVAEPKRDTASVVSAMFGDYGRVKRRAVRRRVSSGGYGMGGQGFGGLISRSFSFAQPRKRVLVRHRRIHHKKHRKG
ncbi:MAG: hypothetical protein QXR60_03770 [Candidatus Nanoarchaeia archaeon]